MTDHELLSEQVRESAIRIAESGAPALSGLYDLTAMRLVRFSVTITRNQHDAEDAVQAALVRVVAVPTLLRNAKAPWAYLLQMVRNESIGILRRKKRWRLVQGITDLLTRRSVDELEREDSHRQIWLALRRLPVEQSEVIVLKIWEDMTFAQIAEILSLPSPTVASRYRYGLQKLELMLHSQASEVYCE